MIVFHLIRDKPTQLQNRENTHTHTHSYTVDTLRANAHLMLGALGPLLDCAALLYPQKRHSFPFRSVLPCSPHSLLT